MDSYLFLAGVMFGFSVSALLNIVGTFALEQLLAACRNVHFEEDDEDLDLAEIQHQLILTCISVVTAMANFRFHYDYLTPKIRRESRLSLTGVTKEVIRRMKLRFPKWQRVNVHDPRNPVTSEQHYFQGLKTIRRELNAIKWQERAARNERAPKLVVPEIGM